MKRRNPFVVIKKEIRHMNWAELKELGEEIGVTASCLYQWQQGYVNNPLWENVIAALKALGYEVEITC